MVRYTFDDLDINYRGILRHWHPGSAAYAGVDQLLHALYSGWVIDRHVHYREHPFSRMRRTMIYYFRLSRGEEVVIVPVINNPRIERLITISPLEFVCINAQTQAEVDNKSAKQRVHLSGGLCAMQKIERTITIKASVQPVFAYVSDPSNLGKLWPDMLVVEDIQRLPNGGRRFRWTAKIIGARCEGTSEDKEFTVNQRIVRQIGGGLKGTVTWVFQSENEGTQVSLLIEYTIPLPLLRSRTATSIIEGNERDIDVLLANLQARTETQITVRTD